MPLKLRLALRFWSSFAPASVFITICCGLLARTWGTGTIGTAILLKAGTAGIFIFLVNEYQSRRLYYYHNHGLSKMALWTRALGIDMAVFLIALSLSGL